LLKEQQDKINEQSPEDMQKRLDEADARKAETGSYRPEGDAKARNDARDSFRTKRQSTLEDEFLKNGDSIDDAMRKAEEQTAQEIPAKDATHELDSIVGGNENDDLSLGDRAVNRSVGSQWKSRVKDLKQAVRRAKKRGQEKMNVKLEPCEPTS
jgi:hypothetical protein